MPFRSSGFRGSCKLDLLSLNVDYRHPVERQAGASGTAKYAPDVDICIDPIFTSKSTEPPLDPLPQADALPRRLP